MNRKILLSTLIALGMVVATASSAHALYFSDLTGNTLKFDGTDTVMIDFNKGGSDIRDDGNMWFNTDDSIYLHAPTSVVFWSNTIQFWPNLSQPTLDFNKGDSKIYDDGDLFIKTDDNIYLQGTTIAKGTLRPDADDTYDLGTSTKEWRNLYVDGTANLDTVDISGNLSVGGTITGTATVTTLSVTGNTTLGDAVADSVTANAYFTQLRIGTGSTFGHIGTVGADELGVEGQIEIDGAAYFDSTMDVDGAVTLNGNVTLGNAATDTITVTGSLAGTSPLILEGATADGTNAVTIALASEPGAAYTITIPLNTGTLVTTTSGGTMTGTWNFSGATVTGGFADSSLTGITGTSFTLDTDSSGAVTQDLHFYFEDDGVATAHHLMWDDDPGNFAFSDGLTVDQGGVTVTAGGATVTAGGLTVTAGGLTVTAGDVDVNAQKVILDADQDTSVTADTDDQVDLEIAGADEWVFTADQLDATNGQIVNIGNAGTDFLTTGGLTLANALTVTTGGATITAGGLTVTAGDVTVTAGDVDFDASGGNAADPDFSVDGYALFASGVDFNSTVYVDGASFQGNFVASADDQYDIGASGTEWQDAYFDGTVNTDILVVSVATNEGVGADLWPTADNTYDLGGPLRVWAEGYFTSVLAGTGDPLTITANAASTWSSSAGALTLTSAAAATWSTAAGALTVSGDDGLTLTAANTAGITMNSTAGTWLVTATGQTMDMNGTTLDVDTTGAINLDADLASNFNTAAGDITIDAETGSIIIDGGEAITDAVVIRATGANGGIDITSLEDIDITTTGAAGEDISITNTGGSVIVTATESIADAIVINASGAAGGIDFQTGGGAYDFTGGGAFNYGVDGTAGIFTLYSDTAGESLVWNDTNGNLTLTSTTGAAADVFSIVHTASDTFSSDSLSIDVIDNTATGDVRGLVVSVNDAGAASPVTAVDIEANDTGTALSIGQRIIAAANATITTGLQILAGANGAVTTAIDVSDAEIATAISAGDNTISGGATVIDFTDFDVSADGLVILAPDDGGTAITVTPSAALTTGLDVSNANITNGVSLGATTLLGTTAVIDFSLFDVAATGAISVINSADVVGLTIAPSIATATAIDVSDADITNAISVGANTIAITTGTIGSNGAAVIDFTDFDVSADGLVVFASDGAGDQITITTPAADFQAMVVDASTADSTQTAGMIDLNVDSSTTTAVGGLYTTFTSVDDDAADTMYAQRTDVVIADDTTATDTIYGHYIDITNSDTNAAGIGLAIVANDAGAGVVTAGLLIDNAQATDIDITDGILITATTADSIADAIDVSDAEITNAINVGANVILGTTATINFTGFDVDAAGNITVAAAEGLDTNGAGALELGIANATSITIGSASITQIDITTDAGSATDVNVTGSVAASTSVTATTFMTADAYRVTNGTTITATGELSKATLQGASFFPVNPTIATDIDLVAMDAGDVGRKLIFAHTATAATDVTVTSGTGMTVTNIEATGTLHEDIGDFVECLITSTSTATCVGYSAD